MKKLLRWLGYGLAAIFVILIVGAAYVWIASARALGGTYVARPEHLVAPGGAALADAPRQARIHGCVGCHGAGLRGRLRYDKPNIARIWAPNLTQVAAGASDQQLAQAIRQGIGHDGRALWVMPSSVFSRLSDEEVAALIAFIRSLPRGPGPVARIAPGPIGRIGIVTARFKPIRAEIPPFASRWPFDAGAEHAAGRQIAARVCAECHGPDLTGGQADPDHKAPDLIVAGPYDAEQFRRLMRTGRSADGHPLQIMPEVARSNLRFLDDAEIDGLYLYLRARAERMPQ